MRLLLSLSLCICLLPLKAQDSLLQYQSRLITHELLKACGDSSSVIGPVKLINQRYRVDISQAWQPHPDSLIAVLRDLQWQQHEPALISIIRLADSAEMYSYVLGDELNPDACLGRQYPPDLYRVEIAWTDKSKVLEGQEPKAESKAWIYLLIALFVGLLGGYYLSTRKISQNQENEELVFDTDKMQLRFGDKDFELSAKEFDLLYLLYKNKNQTLSREQLLEEVWDNPSDYLGRTLDVFVSRLRKKCAPITSFEIVSVRGVGYRLTTN